jgi:hypothetical protein
MEKRLNERSHIISIILLLIVFLLWVFSTFQARTTLLKNGMGELGLFSILPSTFFIAFSLLIFSLFFTLQFVKKHRTLLLVIQTLLLILFLFLTPAIVEDTPRFTAGYAHFKSVDVVTQTGYLDPSIAWELNWPSFSIFWSIFVQITSIPWQSLLLVYPTFVNILLFAALFIFFSAMSKNSKMVWGAIWFVYFGNWVGQEYFSMQSITYFIIVLLIFLIFKNMNNRMRNRQWVVIFILFFFYVASSQVLSSISILSVILVLFIFRHWQRPGLFLALTCLTIGWTIIFASQFFSINFSEVFSHFLNLMKIFEVNLVNRVSGSSDRILAAQVRILYSAAILSFSLIGIILTWKNKKLGPTEKRMLMVLIGFFLLLGVFSYAGEMFERVYIYSLLPLAYFASKAIMHKKVLYVLLIFLIIAAPSLYIIAHYGNETVDYVSSSELVGVSFFYKTTTNGEVIGGGWPQMGDFRDPLYRPNYTFLTFSNIMNSYGSEYLWTALNPKYENRYVCMSSEAKDYFSFFLGNPVFMKDLQENFSLSTEYNLVYSNPSFSVYCYNR